jgi:hypothetical protein
LFLVVGVPGSGKSAFLQSHPGAFIINTDNSSTTTPTVRATIWPGIDDSGDLVDAGGMTTEVTWATVMKKVDVLFDLANQRKPRPETVVMDSLGSLVPLAMDHITAKYNKATWNDLDGRRSHPELYRTVLDPLLRLVNVGYGVGLTMHIVSEFMPIGDDRFVERMVPAIGPLGRQDTGSLWRNINPKLELCMAVTSEWRDTLETHEMPGPLLENGKRGRPVQTTKKIRTRHHVLSVQDENLDGIVKCRVNLPPLELPLEDGWSTFFSAYTKASNH